MKKIMSLLAAVMLMCPACSGIAAAETLRTEVTREWIQEVYGFSDEDLEGVAVEEVAEALWWTRDEVQREFGSDSRGLLRNLKWGQKQLELHRTEHHYKESAYDVIIGKRMQGKLPGFENLKRIDFRAECAEDGFFCKISGMLDMENRKNPRLGQFHRHRRPGELHPHRHPGSEERARLPRRLGLRHHRQVGL